MYAQNTGKIPFFLSRRKSQRASSAAPGANAQMTNLSEVSCNMRIKQNEDINAVDTFAGNLQNVLNQMRQKGNAKKSSPFLNNN